MTSKKSVKTRRKQGMSASRPLMEMNNPNSTRKRKRHNTTKILSTNDIGKQVGNVIDLIKRENINIILIQATQNYNSAKIKTKFEEVGLHLLGNKVLREVKDVWNYKGTCIAARSSPMMNSNQGIAEPG